MLVAQNYKSIFITSKFHSSLMGFAVISYFFSVIHYYVFSVFSSLFLFPCYLPSCCVFQTDLPPSVPASRLFFWTLESIERAQHTIHWKTHPAKGKTVAAIIYNQGLKRWQYVCKNVPNALQLCNLSILFVWWIRHNYLFLTSTIPFILIATDSYQVSHSPHCNNNKLQEFHKHRMQQTNNSMLYIKKMK